MTADKIFQIERDRLSDLNKQLDSEQTSIALQNKDSKHIPEMQQRVELLKQSIERQQKRFDKAVQRATTAQNDLEKQ